jgi:hypothetical protein
MNVRRVVASISVSFASSHKDFFGGENQAELEVCESGVPGTMPELVGIPQHAVAFAHF